MSTADALTLTEAGDVLDRSATSLNKAVGKGVTHAQLRRVGGHAQRLLGLAEMRLLLLARRFEEDLTTSGQKRLYEAIRKLPADEHRITLGVIELDLDSVDEDLKKRLDRLYALQRGGGSLVQRPVGSPDHGHRHSCSYDWRA